MTLFRTQALLGMLLLASGVSGAWADGRAPVTAGQVPACPAQAEGRRLRVGMPDDRPPLSHVAMLRPAGLAAEYLALLPPDAIELLPLPTVMLRQRLAKGTLDAVVGLPESAVPEGWLRSGALLEVPAVIMTRRRGRPAWRPGDLRGRSLAVLDPLPHDLHDLMRTAHRIDDPAVAVDLLERSSIDAVIGNGLLLRHAVASRGDSGATTTGAAAGFDQRIVLAVAPGCGAWLQAFEQARGALGAVQRARINQRALRGNDRGMSASTSFIAVASLLALLLGGGFHLHAYRRIRQELACRRQLHKQVNEISANLPVVVFQARHLLRARRLCIDFLAGDTPQLFADSTQALKMRPQRILDAVDPRDRWRLLRALATAAGDAPGVLHLQFRCMGVRGPRTVSLHARLLRQEGKARTWSGHWLDITDRAARSQAISAARAAAQQDLEHREQLLECLGESLQVPLQALQQRIASLHAGTGMVEDRAALEALQDASRLLGRIMQETVAVARGDAFNPRLDPMPLDLPGLLQRVVHALEPLAQDKGLALVVDVDGRLADWLLADGVRLRQILFNVLGNAIKFTTTGHVALVVRVLDDDADQQRVAIEVRDTGIGIDPSRMARIFDPFLQADPTISRRYGGSGLGLGICRRLAEAMGGTLQLQSMPDVGTQARLLLPLQKLVAPPTPAAMGTASDPVADRVDVLLAEDHPTHRMILAWMLRDLGLAAQVAEDGVRALALWQRHRPRLVLTDDQMPGMDGRELARAIRADPRQSSGGNACIIGMSADPHAADDVHFDALLGKPLQEGELRATIARLVPRLLATAGPPRDGMPAAPRSDALEEGLAWPSLATRFGSEATARALIDSLQASLSDDVEALQRELQQADTRALARRLHRLAGGLGSVGMTVVATWLRDLAASPELSTDAAAGALPVLQQCLERVQALHAS